MSQPNDLYAEIEAAARRKIHDNYTIPVYEGALAITATLKKIKELAGKDPEMDLRNMREKLSTIKLEPGTRDKFNEILELMSRDPQRGKGKNLVDTAERYVVEYLAIETKRAEELGEKLGKIEEEMEKEKQSDQ